jgi:predicted kinase
MDTSVLTKEETPEVTTKAIEKEIKIIKSPSTPDTYDVMYDDKIIKQLYKKGTKFKGQNEYIVIEPSDGSFDDTFIGLNNSKERVKQNLAKQILDDSKQKEAISELNKPEQVDKAATDQEVKKEPFEFPSEEVRNQEINLSKNLFELSQNNPTLDMYEQYKNNPIIQNKIESSKKAYVDTSAKEGYGTADYWANRKFVDKTVGYKDFIKKVYGEGAPKKNKEMYIVMGPSSAGKSTSLVDRLVPETGSYLADSDEIKKLLPEFTDGYNAGGVHKESSDINQRIMKIALARGDNIVYPTTGREPAKLAKEIERAEKYGYTPKVYLVTADREVLLLRNLERMLSTNRVVDSDLLLNEQLIKDINKTYENLPEKYKAGKYDTSKDKR